MTPQQLESRCRAVGCWPIVFNKTSIGCTERGTSFSWCELVYEETTHTTTPNNTDRPPCHWWRKIHCSDSLNSNNGIVRARCEPVCHHAAESIILAELWAKMPEGPEVWKHGGRYWASGIDDRCDDDGVDRGGFTVSLGPFNTPLEAALVCHEHAKGIR